MVAFLFIQTNKLGKVSIIILFFAKKLWKVSENGIDQSQTSVVLWSIAAFPIVRQIETDLQMFIS